MDQIDLLARNTTWTLEREAGLGVAFAGILYYDGQAFMVPQGDPARTVADLRGATVCVEKGTTHQQHLDDAAAKGWGLKPLALEQLSGVTTLFSPAAAGPTPPMPRNSPPCGSRRRVAPIATASSPG